MYDVNYLHRVDLLMTSVIKFPSSHCKTRGSFGHSVEYLVEMLAFAKVVLFKRELHAENVTHTAVTELLLVNLLTGY